MAGEREEAETRWYLYVVSFGEPVNPRRGTSLTEREGDIGISLVTSCFFFCRTWVLLIAWKESEE